MTDDAETQRGIPKDLLPIPLHERMGLTVLARGPHSVTTVELSDDVRGAFDGTVHGGILATLADVTCALSTWGTYDVDLEVPVTTDIHVRYYRQPLSGPLTANAVLVHAGRRILTSECSIVDGQNRELARATATFMLISRE